MYPFVESLRIQNGEIHNIEYHNERMNRTRREVFGCKDVLDLADSISPELCNGLVKCRAEYKEDILKVEYAPYQRRDIRSLHIVECNSIDYHYKSADRRLLNELFEQRAACDDILIIKNNLLTDTSAANIALSDGTQWYTPASPLLPGTARTRLLEQQTIKAKNISIDDLTSYQTIRLFNAMIDFGQIEFPVSAIVGLAGGK